MTGPNMLTRMLTRDLIAVANLLVVDVIARNNVDSDERHYAMYPVADVHFIHVCMHLTGPTDNVLQIFVTLRCCCVF